MNDQINQLLANHVAGLRIAVDRLAELYPNGAVDNSTAEWLQKARDGDAAISNVGLCMASIEQLAAFARSFGDELK